MNILNAILGAQIDSGSHFSQQFGYIAEPA